MTPLDTESEQIRESTQGAYELANKAGLNPVSVKQFYRPVDGSKRIATGQIELAPINFEQVQALVNEYNLRGYKVSFSPFFNGSNGMNLQNYIERAKRLFKGRPKTIKITLTDTGFGDCLPSLKRGNDFVSREHLELIVRESKAPAQSNISNEIDRLIKV